ncbi:hypothetical protein [Pseudonocardia sp. MH-G8]|uniref:hypothetical protein n=1 Tax=Pseudonocardia sp. MH-G8 TaxID=1854588 RepID=UPI00117B199E|nr:hypothetical protein [Pseudonocardia sp. MH-G8]
MMIVRGAGVAVAVLAALAIAAPPALAATTPPSLSSGAADMRVEGDSAVVELRYVFTAGPGVAGPVETVPFTALRFGPEPISEVHARTLDGRPLHTTVAADDRRTTVHVAPQVPLAAGQELELVLGYRVARAARTSGDELICEVPVLAPQWAPADSTPGVFTANLLLAPGYDYVEGFPSTPARVSRQDGRTLVAFDVSTAPALIRAVSTSGTPAVLTYDRIAQGIIVVLLIGGIAGSYLHLRASTRRDSSAAGRSS